MAQFRTGGALLSSAARPDSYQGQPLGPAPHILVIFRDQIGDFVVATPLLRGLRERYPDLVLDYLGGERTRELEEASSLIDARFSLFGGPGGLEGLPRFLASRQAAPGPYDLAINLESDPAAAHACALAEARFIAGAYQPTGGEMRLPEPRGIDRLWHEVWNRPDLLRDYPELSSQYIAEVFCRLARVETDYARTEVPVAEPSGSTPSVLLAAGGGRSAKLWAPGFWLDVATWCQERGLKVGLLGAGVELQTQAYHAAQADELLIAAGVTDLRGQLSLPQVAGALARARVFVTVDSGLLHLAAAVQAPTIALFGASPRRLWAPPVPWVTILDPAEPCLLCEENRFRNEACLLPVHQCMLSIAPGRVIRELERILA